MSSPKLRIILVAGARPNFMKIAPILRELRKNSRVEAVLAHTGQHYDFQMSEVFFRDLAIPKPDIFLKAGPGSHAAQTGRILAAFEKVLKDQKPDRVVVVGDVNSAVGCALAASKMGIKIAHVESGLRSFDRRMPEEINRVLTDHISDALFVSEESGLQNLKKEGITGRGKVFFVGNVMIDSLLFGMKAIRSVRVSRKLGVEGKKFCVTTIHRPSNVDLRPNLERTFRILSSVSRKLPVIFPVHPRTLGKMRAHGLYQRFLDLKNLKMTGPLGYTEFLSLVRDSCLVLTDSGGIQEETTFLKIPCMTLRENTERPSTIKPGSNLLVGTREEPILKGVRLALSGRWKKSGVPRYWDGKAAGRIAKILTHTV